MKTFYLALILSISVGVNVANAKNSNEEIDSSKVKTEKPLKSISGLKIVNCNSEKMGKHIYVVSDLYTKKRIAIFNENGQKVYSVATVGSPIYLSNFKKGTYKLKVTEEGKTAFEKLIVE